MKNLICFLLLATMLSCAQEEYKPNPESISITKSVFSKSNVPLTIESCQNLIDSLDKAIAIDTNYFQAYKLKHELLWKIIDLDRLEVNSKKMIQLAPAQPAWKMQLALVYEFKKDTLKANEQINIAIQEYENALQSEYKDDLNMWLEYVQTLAFQNEKQKATEIAKELEQKFPNNPLGKDLFEVFKSGKVFLNKEEMTQFIMDNQISKNTNSMENQISSNTDSIANDIFIEGDIIN